MFGLPHSKRIIVQHVPAVFVQLKLLAQISAAIEDPQAFRAEHPLVAVGHGEGAVAGLGVEGQGTQLLDGIDAQQHALGVAALAQLGQVQAQAAGVLHGADGHESGPGAASGQQIGLRRLAQTDFHHLDAKAGQGFPDHPVGGELLIADHHLVAALPIEAEGDEGECLGGVLHQGDVAAGGRIEQAGQAIAQALFQDQPAWIVARTVLAVFGGEFGDGLRGALGPRGHGRVVEVSHGVGLREFVLPGRH
jgi:hypothetical protein